ncbi:MAG: DUF4476 domain-containing protein [Prevotellaceae bacterium]|jgi:outer membrane protein assembly factor BamE (lipoprotein component of BamABCDE complex)|nr:DUF4476 domain-containing protein [Prevotellaceae bacterium]
MKPFHTSYLLLLLLLPLIGGCSAISTFGKKSDASMQIQKGMRPEEITALMGKPTSRSFDRNSEYWVYRKDVPLYNRQEVIEIGFTDGRVTMLRSYQEPIDAQKHSADHSPTPPPPPLQQPPHPGRKEQPVTDNQLEEFIQQVKNTPFEDDRMRMTILFVKDKAFNCNQCARLMNLYVFTDDKFKVLQLVSPHLYDKENYDVLVRQVGILEKERVERMLLRN